MDTKAEAPRMTLTLMRSLLVVVWREPRLKLAPQSALRVLLAARLASTYSRLYLFNYLIYYR